MRSFVIILFMVMGFTACLDKSFTVDDMTEGQASSYDENTSNSFESSTSSGSSVDKTLCSVPQNKSIFYGQRTYGEEQTNTTFTNCSAAESRISVQVDGAGVIQSINGQSCVFKYGGDDGCGSSYLPDYYQCGDCGFQVSGSPINIQLEECTSEYPEHCILDYCCSASNGYHYARLYR